MSFKIKEVSAIRIFSNDIKKSRDFYKTLFNQEPVEDLELFVSFKIGGSCFEKDGGPRRKTLPRPFESR
jgi:hypothetical protein